VDVLFVELEDQANNHQSTLTTDTPVSNPSIIMILNRNLNYLVGIVLVWIAAFQETHAFVHVTVTVPFSGKIHGNQRDRIGVASFQRGDGLVLRNSNGLSEWNIPELPLFSSGGSFVTSATISAVPTLDPTTLLSDVFGTILGTPLILAIPIVAALGVATLIAFAIVAYANPAEDEE
jgi:hypothetical protein